jgi:hypothetical protein
MRDQETIQTHGTAMVQANEGQGAALAVRELAEIRGQMQLAHEFPRRESLCYEKLSRSCERASFADKAEYSFERGGKPILGGSVYLAREMARTWGNIGYGFRVVPTASDDEVQIEGYARDFETNAVVMLQSRFKKLIQRGVWDPVTRTKETQWVEPSERDLRELVNKHGAILTRNCVFALMPPDMIDDAISVARATNEKQAGGDLKKDRPKTIRALCTAFRTFAVSVEMLEEKLGHPVTDIDDKELAEMRGIFRSMKDGNTQREDHFEFKATGKAATDELDRELQGDTGKAPRTETGRKKRGITKVQKRAFEDMIASKEIDGAAISPHLPDEGDTVLEAIDSLTQEQATPLLKRAMAGEFKLKVTEEEQSEQADGGDGPPNPPPDPDDPFA